MSESTNQYLTIPTKDESGSFKAYVAMPKATPAPTIIVIQEIFGINQEMRDKCDYFASLGYIAVCPDLFWRIEEGVELTDKSEEEWQKAFELFNKFDVDKGVEDLHATLHTFKGHADGNGKVGCVGYCLGGKLAYLMATRSKVNVSVGYYGVGLDELLDEAKNIEKPLMLHVAGRDEYCPQEAQERIMTGLADNSHVTLHHYPHADHAFARGNGVHYKKEEAELANARTADFFNEYLKDE